MALSAVVVGAGLSGLACALQLHTYGVAVHVLEKSRGMGGRMSTRRDSGWRFEHGAPHTPALAMLRAAATDPARPLHVSFGTQVQSLAPIAAGWEVRTDDGRLLVADMVLLATPAPQAVVVLDRGDDAHDQTLDPHGGEGLRAFSGPLRDALATVQMSPCWSVMVAVDGADPSVALQQLGDPALALRRQPQAGRDHDAGSAWVVQMSAEWSAARLETDPRDIEALVASAFESVRLEPLFVRAHRWRYARVTRGLSADCLWMGDAAIGACGDWGGASRHHAPTHGGPSGGTDATGCDRAMASGRALARQVLAHYNIARDA